MTASVRRIDLVCRVLSPLAVGAVALLDVRWAALLIAAWNVFSGIAEYWLLLRIWHMHPSLKEKPPHEHQLQDQQHANNASAKLERADSTSKPKAAATATPPQSQSAAASEAPRAARQNSSRLSRLRSGAARASGAGAGVQSERQREQHEADAEELAGSRGASEAGSLADPLELGVPFTEDVGASPYAKGTTLTASRAARVADALDRHSRPEAAAAPRVPLGVRARRLAHLLAKQPRTLYEGWRAYMRQSALLASVAMALLYLTVLSWDSLTISYAITQGVAPWLCALVNALSAITGIVRPLHPTCPLSPPVPHSAPPPYTTRDAT